MKKIFLLSLTAILAIATFNSCDNDEIDVRDINPAPKVFPEPCTTWGCTVDSVKKHMSPFGLTFQDVYEKDVTLADGSNAQKWFATFSGTNPYSSSNNAIVYEYCFDESGSGLKAIGIYLNGYGQFSNIETQLNDGGYTQTGRDIKDKYYI